MYTDLPEDQLHAYRSSQRAPEDFDEFWRETLAEARSKDGPVSVTAVDTVLETLDVFDVTFPGYDGQPVKAWLRTPRGARGPLPTVVEYVGYGGGRGRAVDSLLFASAGYAHLHMDTRGQGSVWSSGDTPDLGAGGPQVPGMMTRGIEDPHTYYYRRLFTDAARAVDAARGMPVVDASRIALLGRSQGGGTALAVSALVPGVAALVPHVPFLCDFPRATVITDALPYKEIGKYLAVHRDRAEQVHRTLSYFDGVNFARRSTVPARFSVGLMDEVTPPSTVFAAYHEYQGPKEIDVWRYNGHEGGETDDNLAAMAFLRRRLAAVPAGG